jgi:heme-degrading monooxygenase HmoA
MYARVVTNEIRAGKIDEWLGLVRESIVPALREVDGFKEFVALVDRDAGKSIGYSVWDTEEKMLASETSGNYREQIAKLGAVLSMAPTHEAYELVVVA